MHTPYNVVTLLIFIDECCTNLVNVLTILNVLLIIVVYDYSAIVIII